MKHCLVSIYICFFQQFSHLYWSSEQPKKETGLTGVSLHQHFVASLIYALPVQNNLHPFVQCIKSFSIFVSLASVISHSLSFALCKCNYTSVCFQCHFFLFDLFIYLHVLGLWFTDYSSYGSAHTQSGVCISVFFSVQVPVFLFSRHVSSCTLFFFNLLYFCHLIFIFTTF